VKVLDLFSGIGGFSLGLERAGMETVAFCEYDKFCQQVLKKHWPHIPIHEDVRTLDAKQYRGTVDVVCGGFPCQPHSFSGKRKASEDDRDMWPATFDTIRKSNARWFIGENVKGILSSESGRFFGKILSDLASIGYSLEWFNIPGGAVGSPHLRNRIWMVAHPDETQLEGRSISSRIYEEYTNAGYTRWGKDKPGVVRTLNGLPNQMDRVGALGNAVIPDIPELIGRAIIKLDQSLNLT
jgi:DNA (cytosine-5)-methyltransferase 1